MSEEIKGVESINGDAPTIEEGVEIKEVKAVAPEPIQEVDYEALLREKEEQLAKIAQERENYKQGMLRAKGKASEEDIFAEEVADEDKLRAIVREELLSTESAKIAKEREELLNKVLRENKELKLSNRTKAQVASAPVASGGNLDRPEASTQFWTDEQLAVMKSRGIDPEKARENYIKLKSQTN